MGSIGPLLRQEREKRGLTLSQVEEATNIRLPYLEAMEEENFQSIPGKVYAMGFLRNYARFLELDPNPLMDELKVQWKGESIPASTPVMEEDYSGKPENHLVRYLGYGVSVLALLTLMYVGYRFSVREAPPLPPPRIEQSASQNASQPEPASPAPAQTPAAPQTQAQQIPLSTPTPDAAQEQTEASPAPEQAPPPVLDGVKVTVRVKDREAWLRVLEDGQKKYEGTMKPGETMTFQGKSKVYLHTGDAGAVEVEQNGQILGPMGGTGVIAKKEFIKQ